jgi:chromosome segregation ATPase
MSSSKNTMQIKDKKTLLTIGVVAVLLISLGYLGIVHRSLIKERNGLLVDRSTLEQKATMLKKSFSEQKAQTESSIRARQATEAKMAKANQLLTEQEGQVKELQGKVEELEAQWEKRSESDKEQQEQVRQAIDQWKAKVEELQANSREQKSRIAELEGVVATTKAALGNETVQHTSCREKNTKLATISQELATNYQKKGVIDVLSTNEPLTQLKKVEMEKLVQEYLDRIDTEVLPKTGVTR